MIRRTVELAALFISCLCVFAVLAAVAIAPAHPATRYVDILGSISIAGYLLWSGLRMMQSHLGYLWGPFQRLREYLWTIF